LISANKKFVLLLLREEKQQECKMEIKASLEGCDNKQKQQLEQLIEPY
jgi:hypothetical protein